MRKWTNASRPGHARRWLGVAAIAALAGSSSVAAETTNPNVVTFLPSAQHFAMMRRTVPVVTRYVLEVSPLGSTRPSLTIELGKPAPGSDGYIRVDIGSRLTSSGLTGVLLQGRITVEGPGGLSRSPISNLFRVESCRYVVVGSLTVPHDGGTVTTAVAASPRCTWEPATNTSWLSAATDTAEDGTGRLTVTALGNPSGEGRGGVVAVGPHLVVVLQD